MMKICILKESLNIGGTERSAANISVALAERHDVDVVLYDASNIQYSHGGRLFDLKAPASKSLIVKVVNNIRRVLRFRRYVRTERPDVIFQFISYKHPLSRMRFGDCLKLVSARDFAMLEQHTDMVKRNLDASDGLVCNSEYMRDFYLEKYPGDADKVFAVPNIIDISQITRQAAEPVADSAFLDFCESHERLIVSTGRFCRVKAFERLIAALARCRSENGNIGLVLVGDGAYREAYLRQIAELGLDEHVYITGYQKNPYKYMRRGDVFALSSLNEGFPNVLAEAMALGMPVVSTNCLSGPAEILMDSADYSCTREGLFMADYGILVSPNDEQTTAQLSQAIGYLLNNEDERRRYADAAVKRAEKFSANAAAERFGEIFARLAAGKRMGENSR